jgi:SAM-dependent methyltransferase
MSDPVIMDVRCSDCEYLDTENERCSFDPGQPRSCVKGTNRNFVEVIEADESVLEIGCGDWSYLRDHLADGQWCGIDVVETDVTSKVGSVGDIPYPDESFEYVVSNQSMEHWYEWGTPLRRGLSEISRVLTHGGQAWLNVPIHLHGHGLFVRGDLDGIRAVFDEDHWSLQRLEKWRQEYAPEDPCYSWQENVWVPDDAIPADDDSVWMLNIVAEKTSYQKSGPRTRLQYAIDSRIATFVQTGPVPNHHIYLHNLLRICDTKRDAAAYALSLLREKLTSDVEDKLEALGYR